MGTFRALPMSTTGGEQQVNVKARLGLDIIATQAAAFASTKLPEDLFAVEW
jgi:hypothetical protein